MNFFKKQILKEIKEVPTAYLVDETITNGESFHFIVLDLLGLSLQDIFDKGHHFSVKTIFELGHDMVQILEKVHKKGIVHW